MLDRMYQLADLLWELADKVEQYMPHGPIRDLMPYSPPWEQARNSCIDLSKHLSSQLQHLSGFCSRVGILQWKSEGNQSRMYQGLVELYREFRDGVLQREQSHKDGLRELSRQGKGWEEFKHQHLLECYEETEANLQKFWRAFETLLRADLRVH